MDTATARRLLIVDDDSDAAALLAMLVTSIHHLVEVRMAGDGEAGLSTACQWRPDVVLTDIDMPLLSGIEAALEMRSVAGDRQPLIAAFTGHACWCEDPMAIAVFDVMFVKPLDIEALIGWCRWALAGRASPG